MASEAQIPYIWQPGQSGNLSGRPKNEFSITTELKKQFREDPEAGPAFVRNLIAMASKGHPVALNIVVNRMEGLLKQVIEIPVAELTDEEKLRQFEALVTLARTRAEQASLPTPEPTE